MAERLVKWFDLSRFGAALRVVPLSPLRGVALTCLDIVDAALFQEHIREAFAGDADQGTERWWSAMEKLGFSRQGEYYDRGDNGAARSFRAYSMQREFRLAALQEIVPGLDISDLREMPIESIAIKPTVLPEMSALWKDFTQNVLAAEAASVWVPKLNPFEKPYSEARSFSAVVDEHQKAGRNTLLDGDPVNRWFVARMNAWNYRENALCVYFADQASAVAAGHAESDLQQVTMPYALPLLIGNSGRVIALRDVRYAHEILAMTPVSLLGNSAESGIATPLLRAAPEMAQKYRDEIIQWKAWEESAEGVTSEMLEQSLHRVVSADIEFVSRFEYADKFLLGELLQGGRMARGSEGERPIKPLSEWNGESYRVLARRASAYGANADGQLNALVESLHRRARGLDADIAKASAQAALERVVEVVQESPKEASPEKVRHEDVGRKIGGARKDYGKRAMNRDDLEQMNEHERKSLVVKKNVWAPLDYEAMREAGVTPQAAVAIKYLKDLLATEPDRRHSMSEDPDGEYIDAISRVRDKMANVKLLPEFAAVCHELYLHGRGDTNYIYGGSPFQVQIGSKAAHLFADSAQRVSLDDNSLTEPCVAGRIRLEVRRKVRDGREWASLIKPKQEKTDAEREAIAERNAQLQELHRPHLAKVERVGGRDWRAGRDVVGQELLEHFGFYGIEHGNWVDQQERQIVLNMAFDSLCDMADALDLPPRSVSLGGKLAVAFGARGTGGRGAALAHFEPARMVINLTRMKGAGSLSHELWHANDWVAGKLAGYATDAGRARFTDDPLPKLIDRLMHRAPTVEEVLEKSQKKANTHKQYAISWVSVTTLESKKKVEEVMQQAFDAAHLSLYEIAFAKLKAGGSKAAATSTGAVAYFEWEDVASGFLEALIRSCEDRPNKKAREAMEQNTATILRNMAWSVTIEAARDAGIELDSEYLSRVHPVETDFYKQAQVLDESRSDKYWSTVVEMFARAGEQYVFYKLQEKGVRSDYLVHGVEESRFTGHPIGNPYPNHEDRMALAPHFDAFVDEFRKEMMREIVMEESTPEP